MKGKHGIDVEKRKRRKRRKKGRKRRTAYLHANDSVNEEKHGNQQTDVR